MYVIQRWHFRSLYLICAENVFSSFHSVTIDLFIFKQKKTGIFLRKQKISIKCKAFKFKRELNLMSYSDSYDSESLKQPTITIWQWINKLSNFCSDSFWFESVNWYSLSFSLSIRKTLAQFWKDLVNDNRIWYGPGYWKT